jgi:hypothetical protein
MWQPESQVIVPQPTVVVVNNNNGPPPHPQQGMYGYGPVNGQEAYSQQMYGQGPYGVYQGGGGAPWHGSGGGNPGRDGRVRPASPAPAYMGK